MTSRRKRRRLSEVDRLRPNPGENPTGKQIAFARLLRERQGHRRDLFRRVMDWAGVPEHCPRKACRRARRCKQGAPCFEEAWPILRPVLGPKIKEAARLWEAAHPEAERPVFGAAFLAGDYSFRSGYDPPAEPPSGRKAGRRRAPATPQGPAS